MNANEVSITLAQIKRDILNGTPFMITMSHSSPIRYIMKERGYTDEEHATGWNMLYRLMSNRRPWDEVYNGLKEVVAELDRWDNSNFAYARAALEHHFPEQAEYIFKELRAKYGARSLLVIKTFLERIRTLREGLDPHREEGREADRAAVRLLEARNIVGPEIERRLDELIERSMNLPSEPDGDENPFAMDEAAYQELAVAFHAWLKDWRRTARAAIRNRSYLIRLGLTKPRMKKPAPAPEPAVGPEAPPTASEGGSGAPPCTHG